MICIDLVPTEVCKWKCNYCVFPQIDKPKHTTKKIIDRHCDYIKNIIKYLRINNFEVQVVLQGGEVGELSYELLLYILQSFDTNVIISTNGLFMEKGYHEIHAIRQYIEKIFWHVSPDCVDTKITDYEDDRIVRGIVHKDSKVMDKFIENSKMNIEYSEIEVPIGDQSIIPHPTRVRCQRFHNEITIDLVNEQLCLCIRNYREIAINLNKSNLKKLLLDFPENVFNLSEIDECSCHSCCRLCIDRTNKNIIRNKLKLRKIL